MSEYIKLEDALAACGARFWEEADERKADLVAIRRAIDNIETADVAPVIRARWCQPARRL